MAKSLGHMRTGADFERQGQPLAAAREYQAAMGYHAPLNPWCRAAAARLGELARSADDPDLAAYLAYRLRRSLLATRSFYQPHRDLLTDGDRPADPNLALFLGALLGLVVGFGAWWWLGLGVGRRLSLSVFGLVVWGFLLHLC